MKRSLYRVEIERRWCKIWVWKLCEENSIDNVNVYEKSIFYEGLKQKWNNVQLRITLKLMILHVHLNYWYYMYT